MQYVAITGSNPEKIISIDEATSRELASAIFSKFGIKYSEEYHSKRNIHFYRVKRTWTGYHVDFVDVHSDKGH